MALPYEDPNDPNYQLQQEQLRATETPQQIQAEVNQPGTPGAQQDQYQQPQQVYSSPGAGMEPGAAPNPAAFYSGLQRGEDGTLQGVGPGMDYDRQAILQRAMQAGQLGGASDQGQQVLNQPQPQQKRNLQALADQAQLTQAERNTLAAASAGLAQTMSYPGLTHQQKQDAINKYNATIHPLMQKQATAASLAKAAAVQNRFDEHAQGTAAELASQAAKIKAQHALSQEIFGDGIPRTLDQHGIWHPDQIALEMLKHRNAMEVAGAKGGAKGSDPELKADQLHYQKIAAIEDKRAKAFVDKTSESVKQGGAWNAGDRENYKMEFAKAMEDHGYAPTWAEEQAKRAVSPQSQATGTQPAAAQPGATAMPKPIPKAEVANFSNAINSDIANVQARTDMTQDRKQMATWALEGIHKMLKDHGGDTTKFTAEETKQYLEMKTVLSRLAPKPVAQPQGTPAAVPPGMPQIKPGDMQGAVAGFQ